MTCMNWISVKKELQKLPEKEIFHILKEIYYSHPDSKNYLISKTHPDQGIQKYKDIIDHCMYPNVMSSTQKISIPKAKKAISDYSKSTSDVQGTIELMMNFVETGHKFTSDYGDMYEQFYDSLISMFQRITKKLRQNSQLIPDFYDRLNKISNESQNFGWGYCYVADIFSEFCEDMSLDSHD